MTIRGRPQHGSVIDRRHLTQSVVPQRDDRRGTSVMGVGLVAVNRSRCRRSAVTRSSPMTVSLRSSTAAVCDPLCWSIPMVNT
jgi:hypothetical protein